MTINHRLSTSDATAVEEAAETASEHFEWLGRAGWVAKGAVYTLIGVLFVRIAFGSTSEEANQAGAVEKIADTPAGGALLVLVAAGLLLYAIWRALTVILPGDWTGRALLDRIGYAVSTVVYVSLLVSTVGFLRARSAESDQREDRLIEGLVKDVLAITAGRTLVITAGLAVVGIGAAFVHKGWSKGFRDQIVGDDGVENTLIDRLGTIGWIARGISMALIGFFLARAAWMFEPDEAAGLDDSIRQLADNPVGAAFAALVGLGFIAYGVFAALSARYRVLEGPRND